MLNSIRVEFVLRKSKTNVLLQEAQLNAENEALLILWNEERDRAQMAADHKQRAEQAYDKFYISLISKNSLFHDVRASNVK